MEITFRELQRKNLREILDMLPLTVKGNGETVLDITRHDSQACDKVSTHDSQSPTHDSQSYVDMKIKRLVHIIDGKKFVKSEDDGEMIELLEDI